MATTKYQAYTNVPKPSPKLLKAPLKKQSKITTCRLDLLSLIKQCTFVAATAEAVLNFP
ncbi:hypothetical protein [Nostoc sp. C052]|uniref:hypothetical protein n=1 Tax=Nostoc sp. C052 TaxID=2576902 RepID=UPI0015C2F026